MKKLLKEVWKSFSKSKIILAGLTLLVFLTSGIITLLFDVVNTYNGDYNRYKNVSNLQDLTMNTNIEPKGSKPNLVYKSNKVPNIWKISNPKSNQLQSIRVNVDDPYLNLQTLNPNEYSTPTFIDTKQLSYIINVNKDKISEDNNGNKVFNPNKAQLNLYNPSIDGEDKLDYSEISKINEIYKIEKKSGIGAIVGKDIAHKTDLIDHLLNNDDFFPILVDGNNPDKAYIENNDFLTSNIVESQRYKENPKRFLRIEPWQVAKWFGFEKENLTDENYQFNSQLNLSVFNPALNQDEINKISKPSDLKGKKFVQGININLNQAFNTDNSPIKIPKTIILDKNLIIPNDWFVYAQEINVFEQITYKLHDINSWEWGKIYKDYFDTLTENEKKFLDQTSFWTKKSINNLVDNNGDVIAKGKELTVELKSEDLTKEIYNDQGQTSTILKESNLQVSPSQDLATELNRDKSKQLENKIEQETKKLAYKNIFDQITSLVDKIGLRENITVNSNGEKGTEVFHFINIGDMNQENNWKGNKFKQDVGRLVNPTDDSKIYSLESNISKNVEEIPINNLPRILDKLLSSLSLDRNYINPMVSFDSFSYSSDGQENFANQSKVIWLSPNQSVQRKDLIGLTAILDTNSAKKTYYVLKEKDLNQRNWQVIKQINNFDEMSNYIINNNLNLAKYDLNNKPMKVIGPKGWVQANNNYSDQFFVPFQYFLPQEEILEEFNNKQTLEFFTNFLTLKLTETVKPLVNATNFAILMDAVNTGLARSGFATALTPPSAITNQTIVKMIVYILYDTTQGTNQNFINIFISDLLNGIKNKIKDHGQNDLNQEKEYLKQEFRKVGFLLNFALGMDPSLLDVIIDLVQNPNDIIDGLLTIINSFNLDEAIIKLYKEISDPNRPRNQIIASGDYLPALYLNLNNSKGIINGIQKIINTLDLKKMAQMEGLADIAKLLSTIKPLIGTLNFETSAVGYAKLLEQTKLVKGEQFDVIYKKLGLAPFLKLLKLPIPIPGIDINQIIDNLNLPNIDVEYDPDYFNPLSLDLDLIWYIKNFVLTGENQVIFDMNIMNILDMGTAGFSQIKTDQQQIIYDENAAKIALVNEAYLNANNKSIYRGDIDSALNNLDQVDSKYKINVANVEFLITGTNLTVDYMYPVINNENLQVNPSNQAIVYVNQYGYDRIKRSNINSPTESYFLLEGPKNGLTIEELQTKLNQISYQWMNDNKTISPNIDPNDITKNPYQKAFLAREASLINPERAMRITTIEKMLAVLKNVQQIVIIILVLIVSIVIGFVVRRYIVSRAKTIGILKAQGYTSMQIALSICLFPLFVSIIGGTLGYIAGHFSQLGLFNILSIFWTVPILTTTFNWFSMFLTIIVPFLFLSILTIIITLWFLRKTPIILMNSSLEVNDSKAAKVITKSVSNQNIKNKFSVSLALGSIGKLSALFISILITSTITLFSSALFNVFNKAINKTYENRDYAYKTDLITPTIEGGEYTNLDFKNNKNIEQIDQMLYVPSGLPEESFTYLSNYLKPGFNPIINTKLPVEKNLQGEPTKWIDANGHLDPADTTTPHIFTKSSIDLTVIAAGLSVNIWQNLYNTIPESQRAAIVESSEKASKWLEWTQEGQEVIIDKQTYISRFINYDSADLGNEYLTLYNPETKKTYQVLNPDTNKMEDVRLPYFKFIKDDLNPTDSHFEYRKPTKGKYFENKLIMNGEVENNIIRKFYRDFLLNGYQQMFNYQTRTNNSRLDNPTPEPPFALDYFIMAGANGFSEFDNIKDEAYTYIDTTTLEQNNKQRIYGYQVDSQYVNAYDEQNRDLLKLAQTKFEQDNIYPLIVNKVSQQKHGLKVGQKIKLSVDNHFLRNQDRLEFFLEKSNENPQADNSEQPKSKIIEMEIIGINTTYINEEWITTKAVADQIVGLKNNYNGIFTKSEQPVQLANSLTLYAPSGYWSARESIENIDLAGMTDSQIEESANIYKQLFYNVPLGSIYDDNLENKSLVAQHLETLFKQKFNAKKITNAQINLAIKKILELSPTDSLDLTNNPDKVHNALNHFIDIYSEKALQSAFVSTVSKGIEKDFVYNTSGAINQGLTIVLAISLAISLTILIMISIMIINENERNIAIFGILGYSTKEKFQMFFTIYIPIVIGAILLSILLVWLFLPIFTMAILSTAAISLPISLNFANIIISTFSIISIFTITCLIAWWLQGRVKPIMLLKGV